MPETWPTSKIPRSISLFVRHVKNYFAFCSPRDHLATPPPQTPLLTFPSSLSFSLLVPRSANDPSDQSPLRLSLGFRIAPRPSAGSRHQQGPSSASEISNLQTTHGPARFPIAPLSDFAHSARLRPFLESPPWHERSRAPRSSRLSARSARTVGRRKRDTLLVLDLPRKGFANERRRRGACLARNLYRQHLRNEIYLPCFARSRANWRAQRLRQSCTRPIP